MLRLAVAVSVLVTMVFAQMQSGGNFTMGMGNSSMGMENMEEYSNIGDDYVDGLVAKLRLRNVSVTADSNRNGRIDGGEFTQDFYVVYDANNDASITPAEFVSACKERSPFLNAPICLVMFKLLDALTPDVAPGNRSVDDMMTCMMEGNVFSGLRLDRGDGVLTYNSGSLEVSLADLTGEASPTTGQYGEAISKLVRTAAEMVDKNKRAPFKVAEVYGEQFDYSLFFSQLDNDRDGIVSSADFANLFSVIDASAGRVSRGQLASTFATGYGQPLGVGIVFFDVLDANEDGVLDADDAKLIVKAVDINMDERATKQELYRFMQQKFSMIRRALGYPIKKFVYDCKEPSWKGHDSCDNKEEVDATLFAMTLDYNFDGRITWSDVKMYLSFHDMNGDHKVDLAEFIHFAKKRYDVPMNMAAIDFEIIDLNGDGYYDYSDAKKYFNGDELNLCVCEYRLMIYTSAWALKKLAEKREKMADLQRMKAFLLIAAATDAAEFEDEDHDMWRWKTMAGKPGKCTRCSGQDNWKMSDDDHKKMEEEDDMSMNDEEYKMVHALMAALKKMGILKKMAEGKDDWKMLKMMMHAMYILKNEAKGKDSPMGDEKMVSELASFMKHRMEMIKVQEWHDKISNMMDGKKGDDGEGDSEMEKIKKMMMMKKWMEEMKMGDDNDDSGDKDHNDDKEEMMKKAKKMMMMKKMMEMMKGGEDDEDKDGGEDMMKKLMMLKKWMEEMKDDKEDEMKDKLKKWMEEMMKKKQEQHKEAHMDMLQEWMEKMKEKKQDEHGEMLKKWMEEMKKKKEKEMYENWWDEMAKKHKREEW